MPFYYESGLLRTCPGLDVADRTDDAFRIIWVQFDRKSLFAFHAGEIAIIIKTDDSYRNKRSTYGLDESRAIHESTA